MALFRSCVSSAFPNCHLTTGLSVKRSARCLTQHGGQALRRHLCSDVVGKAGPRVIFTTSKFWVAPLGIFVTGLNGFFIWSLYTSLELGVPPGESAFWTHGG
jgi:hypothetical protein